VGSQVQLTFDQVLQRQPRHRENPPYLPCQRNITYKLSNITAHPELPGPLQEFPAYNDFSGDNVVLTKVARFHDLFPKDDPQLGGKRRIEVYNAALEIYINYISSRDAGFPINVSSQQPKDLECMFEASARVRYSEAHTDPVAPLFFDAPLARAMDMLSATDMTPFGSTRATFQIRSVHACSTRWRGA
jgi:hypothetical protein